MWSQAGAGNGVRRLLMNDVMQKKRAVLMAVLLGLLAVGLYFGFMWMVGSGRL